MLSVITTVMLVSESSAPKKLPPLSVVPSSWPNFLSFQSDVVTGVTSSESPIPFHAKFTESVDQFTYA